MRLSHLAYAAAGYVLGSKAGRERYEQIVRLGRRFTGSQTVQTTAGVVQAKLDRSANHARQVLAGRLAGTPARHTAATNGYHQN